MTNRSKIVFLNILFFILFSINKASSQESESNKNFVPNKLTAIKSAEAIWIPIYGNKVKFKKPFVATLVNDSIWIVEGSLMKGEKGGVPHIKIQKRDCKILEVSHDK